MNGNTFSDINFFDNWSEATTNNEIAQNHPILSPAILFVSKLFSQAIFNIENERTGKLVKNHWMIKLLNNPNAFQTKLDFLETLMFSMIANGKAVVLKKYITGFNEPQALHVLNPDLIVWPEDFKNKFQSSVDINSVFGNQKIKYLERGTEREFYIKDLMFFYDLPNCLNKNPFKVRSRLDGLKQTLINTKDSLIAKNIILKSNGKELLTLDKDSMQLSPEEKKDADRLLNVGYGLSKTRKRGLITKAQLSWKSLHIALRDLGLDESTKVDGNIIYTALHIPKDILSLEAKKTTYNNFKESMVSYVQNEMQSSLNAFLATIQKEITEPNNTIKGNYDHLPIMQFILLEKYEVISKRAKALNDLLRTGIPKELALEMCGFDSSLELNEIQALANGQEQQQQQQQANSAAKTEA